MKFKDYLEEKTDVEKVADKLRKNSDIMKKIGKLDNKKYGSSYNKKIFSDIHKLTKNILTDKEDPYFNNAIKQLWAENDY